MSNPAQTIAQHKATAYSCEVAACLFGVTLTQWATIVGIIVALGSLVMAYLTYRSNKWKNEQIVKEAKSHNKIMERDEEP